MLFIEDEFGDLDDEDFFGDEQTVVKDLGDYSIHKSIIYDHDSDWDATIIKFVYLKSVGLTYNDPSSYGSYVGQLDGNLIFNVERSPDDSYFERYRIYHDGFNYVPEKSMDTPTGLIWLTPLGPFCKECRAVLFEILMDIVDDRIMINTDDVLNDLVFLMRDRGVEIKRLEL